MDTFGLPQLGSSAEADTFIKRILDGRSRCWLVLAREWFFDPAGHLPRSLSRGGHLRLATAASGVRVYEWTQQPTGDFEP